MSSKTDTRSMLLNDSPWKLILTLSIPAIVGMVVVGFYNLMDAVYVGQMVSDNAMAAVYALFLFLIEISMRGLLLGASVIG